MVYQIRKNKLFKASALFCFAFVASFAQGFNTEQNAMANLLAQLNQHPFVGEHSAESIKEKQAAITLVFDQIEEFLEGFRYQTILPSAMNCSNFVEGSIKELNVTLEQWKHDQDIDSGYNTTAGDYIFNITEWISYQIGPGIRYCFNIGLEGYSYYLIKDEQFGPFIDWFPAWLQNLLGNVVTFQALYEKVAAASEAENWPEALYWYGRFASIVFEFEPIKSKEDELDFDSGASIPWWLNPDNQQQRLRASDINAVRVNQPHHPHVQGWFDDTFGFITGFLNVTFGESSPNVSVCVNNVTRIVDVSLAFGEHIKVISNDSWLEASENFEEIFKTVHPIFFSCYRSAFEFYEAALYYGVTFTDWNNLVYNLIHNIGYLYDSIYFLVLHHMEGVNLVDMDPIEAQNWWFKLGIYYGNILWRILYTNPDTYEQIDPLADLIGVRPTWMDDLSKP